MLLARQRFRDAMALSYVPAKPGYVSRLVLCINADFETHLEGSHGSGVRRNDPKLTAEIFAFVQAHSNVLGQSPAITGVDEREKVIVLAGEPPSLKTKKRVHLGVPSHDCLKNIPLKGSNSGRI